MWKFLNSRRVAVYLLCIFLGILLASAFAPSPFTVAPEEWLQLQRQGGLRFWTYSHLSTPFIVRSVPFAAISALLFLSTLVCTIDRGLRWWSSRSYEFSKEKAFSFAVAKTSSRPIAEVADDIGALLKTGRWQTSVESPGEGVILSGQRGMSGFWGSMVFHVGLLACFLAAPVTLATGFRGDLTITEDDPVMAADAITSQEPGAKAVGLASARIKVRKVRGDYFQGKFRYDFGGQFSIADDGGEKTFHFAVNQPVAYRGYQFSLSSFGFAPHLVIRGGEKGVDNYLSVSSAEDPNYFTVADDLRAFVLFFPDFVREGGKIGTRSRNAVNPVTMVRLYRGEREVFKGLFRPGEETLWEGKTISIPDFKHWVTFSVTREYGIVFVLAGFALVVGGLFARFLSNERRIEFELSPGAGGTACTVRGYSRYYPAFLEKEVLQMAERLK